MGVIMSMLSLKMGVLGTRRPLGLTIIASSLTFSAALWGQAPPPDTAEPPPDSDKAEPPAERPEAPADKPELASKPEAPEKPVPPPAPPSPFTFTLKGFVSGTFYAQDAAFASGNGNSAIFGPNKLA